MGSLCSKPEEEYLDGKLAKGSMFKKEMRDAKYATDPHPRFGFACLHYLVSEAHGAIKIKILNKQKMAGSVRVCTID